MQIEKLTTPDAIEKRADYYEKWADDIRALNGTSVDADHSAETAAVLRALTRGLEEAKACLKPFAERGRAEFTTGDYHNPEPAPDSQIFGTELFLTIGDLRRAERFLSRAQPGQDDTHKGIETP